MSIVSTQIAQAAAINGVTASSTAGAAFGTSINQIVDNSGLSTPIGLTSTHATADAQNVWIGTTVTPTIDFNLTGSYSLAGFSLWNFNGDNTYGIKGVTVQSSTNGTTFMTIAGAPTQFAIGTLGTSESPAQFSFAPVTASYVRFVVSRNYGALQTGLSEVKFDGSSVAATAVPEPLTIFGTLAGLAGGAGLKRRLKADKSKSV